MLFFLHLHFVSRNGCLATDVNNERGEVTPACDEGGQIAVTFAALR